MEQKKYQKIYDRLNKYNNSSYTRKIKKWVATEKVHGSNFSVYYSSACGFRFAKRNSFLEEGEWFYNYQLIRMRLEKGVKKISELLGGVGVIVYGELFGGWYPDNPKTWTGSSERIDSNGVCLVPQECRAIQEGIYYSPNIEYMVFDVMVEGRGFLGFVEMNDVVKKAGLFVCEPLKIGTYNQLLNYNIVFDSTIPEQLGWGALPRGTNLAEGIVIKPYSTNDRCLVKIKNKKFLEVSSSFDMKKAGKSYKFVLTGLINQNRFQAVISKIGRLTEENKQQVLEDYVEDVWMDLYQNYPNIKIDNYNDAHDFVKERSTVIVDNNL